MDFENLRCGRIQQTIWKFGESSAAWISICYVAMARWRLVWQSFKNWAFVSVILMAILVAAMWVGSCFRTFHATTLIHGSVLGLAIKQGYLDVELVTVPNNDAADEHGAFIYLPPDGNSTPDVGAYFGHAGQWKSPSATVNHKFSTGPYCSYQWHSQFTSPYDFIADRRSQTFWGWWRSGIILMLELPFSILFAVFAYWPALRCIRFMRSADCPYNH